MDPKPTFDSKTIIVNILVIVAMFANAQWGYTIDTEVQAALATIILAAVNILLRYTTKRPIESPVQAIKTLIGK